MAGGKKKVTKQNKTVVKVKAAVQENSLIFGSALGVGVASFAVGQPFEVALSFALGAAVLGFAFNQYRALTKKTTLSERLTKKKNTEWNQPIVQEAAASDDDDAVAEEAEAAAAAAKAKKNKSSARLAARKRLKAEKKEKGESAQDKERRETKEAARAAEDAKVEAAREAKKAAKEAALDPEAEKRKKKKDKAKAKKERLKAMAAAEADEETGEWETVPVKTKKPSMKSADSDDEDGEPKAKVAEATIYFECDVKMHGRIIGPGGATLNVLEEGTGCKIAVPKRGAMHTQIVISGSNDGTEVAKAMLQDLVTKGYCSLTDPDMSSSSIDVPLKLHPQIIGSKGATIRTLQDATNTRINLPDRKADPPISIIEILGSPADVDACKRAIQEIVDDGFSPITHPGWVKLNVAYPGNLFHRLIGPKGATIKALQEESGCRVNLPQDRNILGASAVTVVGPSAGVVKAEASIGALLAKVASEEAAYADSQIVEMDTTGVWTERVHFEEELW